ncbi:extracellular dioxygenase [Morchella snyderi]|nr:extracellular dioxygenase [Morchella snyderi]
MVNPSILITGILALASVALGHGAAETEAGIEARNIHVANARRSLEACQNKLKARNVENRRKIKRDAFVKRYQKQNQKRAATATAVAAATTVDPFNGAIPTCVLAPEEEIGPYYLSGELIRDDVREDEPGVDMLLDVQVFDVSTCEVIPNVMLDFWSCNSTGVYSGFSAENTLGETQLRGLVESDEDGIVQVLTKFPGHYDGRATHLHLIAHIGGSISSTGTYSGGTVPHIGQVFFEQSLISEVEATSPYNTNTVAITLNSVDRVFTEQASVTAGYSDVVTIEKLGSALSDGLLGAISIGLDLTANKSTGTGSGTGTGTGTGAGGAATGGMGGPPS